MKQKTFPVQKKGGLICERIWLSLVLLINLCLCSCDQPSLPPPKLGAQNWKPTPVGGPLELRPLPAASEILKDHKDWTESSPGKIARIYETTLVASSNQVSFTVAVRGEQSPIGRAEHTYASFIYNDPEKGAYEFQWHRLGRHNADFLKIGDTPRQVWVELNWRASKSNLPFLEIRAFEGLEATGVLVAEPGGVQP